MSYYPKPDSHGRNKIKVKLDFPNYVIKSDVKGVTSAAISDFAKNVSLATVVYKIFQTSSSFHMK